MRSPSEPARKPGGPRATDSAPDAPPPAGFQQRLQARYSHASRYSRGPRGSRPVSPGSPLRRPDTVPAAASRAKAPRPGTCPSGVQTALARGASRTMDGRGPPPTALIGCRERPLELCFSIGEYSSQPAAGKRLD